MSDVLGLIPARGGSKGIPHKNVQHVAGEPLLEYTIRASINSATIDQTVVSTDDEAIRKVALESGADAPFIRPRELATDEAATEPVLEHALEYVHDTEETTYESVVLLQPTSPLRNADDIDAAFEKYRTQGADSLVAVFEDHSYRWERTNKGARRVNYGDTRTRRQKKDPEYIENGAIYIVDVEQFLRTGNHQAGSTCLYVMDRLNSIDIDEPSDLKILKCLVKNGYYNGTTD